MATLRAELRDRLAPIIPRDYKLRPNGLQLETPTTPVLLIKQLRMTPAVEAGLGQLVVEFVLTMVVPHKNPQTAENKLDDDVTTMLAAIDRIEWANWTAAEKRTAGPSDEYLAYDITLTVLTTYTPEA